MRKADWQRGWWFACGCGKRWDLPVVKENFEDHFCPDNTRRVATHVIEHLATMVHAERAHERDIDRWANEGGT